MNPDGDELPQTLPEIDDEPVPPALAAAWQQAETTAYTTVTERPDLYERVIHLVRRTADHLRLLGGGTGALVAAAERGPDLVAAVVGDSGISPGDMDLDVLARAALALRYREVRGEQAALRRLHRLAEGRAAGQAWVVAEEAGAPEGDPFLPYSRLEVETGTGRGILVTTMPDDEYRGVVHQVRAARLDLGTGAVEPDPQAPEVGTYPDATARDEAALRLRDGSAAP
jgi:hypothetical protein